MGGEGLGACVGGCGKGLAEKRGSGNTCRGRQENDGWNPIMEIWKCGLICEISYIGKMVRSAFQYKFNSTLDTVSAWLDGPTVPVELR